MLIDTHCHLNMMVDKKRDDRMTSAQVEQVSQIVENASAQGVGKIVNVGTTYNETLNSLALADRYASVFATAGIHPCDVTSVWQNDLSVLKKMLATHKNKIVALGETGLDFFHKPYDAVAQEALFRGTIELSLQHDLPLVVHVRDAGDEALKVLDEYAGETRGVLHCFSLDLQSGQQVAAWGNWYLGIDGPVTYPKNEWLRQVVATIDLEYLLLETDAPFLPPQQFRGKQNSPIHLPIIAQAIAEARGCSIEEVARVTTASAERLFGI